MLTIEIFLTVYQGVSPSALEKKLQFVGYGEYQPLFPKDTKEHKQANRRVNIVILLTG